MTDHQPSRRSFIGHSALAAASAATLSAATRSYAAAGDDTLRVGLIGCGGRGSGAAVNALNADSRTKLVAVGDAFADSAQNCVNRLKAQGGIGDRVVVEPDHIFSGLEAYKHVTDMCDVVLLCTPPHFRPMQIEYAVEKGKHIFAEKPVATDPAGIRRVLAACEKAKQKSLAVVSGLCYRYHYAKRATIDRIHDGAIGDITSLSTYYHTGGLWHRGRQDDWTEMEYQVRNWLYFTWLSGDFITEQHVHSLDKTAWIMGDTPPLRATAMGGRAVRTDPKYGNAYDQFYTTFEYADGIQLHSSCRQWVNCASRVTDHAYGTKGEANIMGHSISGENEWRWRNPEGLVDDMYQNEHNELFASIRANEPINNGEYMSHSSMMAIMARMSAYTGQVVTWEQAMNSKLDLSPERYDWDSAPDIQLAVPGVTQFV
ncbi:MAG: Gfo/Idh/MocA family oxidoreductase [Phycisphaeraceae bacterium]